MMDSLVWELWQPRQRELLIQQSLARLSMLEAHIVTIHEQRG